MVIIKKLNEKMLKEMWNIKLEHHMTGPHALPDKIFTFLYIYIYIYIDVYIDAMMMMIIIIIISKCPNIKTQAVCQ